MQWHSLVENDRWSLNTVMLSVKVIGAFNTGISKSKNDTLE